MAVKKNALKDKALRAAYSVARRAAKSHARELEKAGFKARAFPTLAEIKSGTELKRQLRAAKKYTTEERYTVEGQRKARERRREQQARYRRNKKYKALGLNNQERQLMETARKYGLNIDPKDLPMFEDYLTTRHGIQKDKRIYDMRGWMEDFSEMYALSEDANERERTRKEIAADFGRYTEDIKASREKYNDIIKKTGYKSTTAATAYEKALDSVRDQYATNRKKIIDDFKAKQPQATNKKRKKAKS